MKKKRNIIRKNSGFIVGCVIAAGASVFAADVVMTDVLPGVQVSRGTTETEGLSEGVLESETETERTYETNAFTITASGSVINGVETEAQTETETDEGQQDVPEDGAGDGSYSDGSSSGDGSYSDGSGTGDGSYSDGSSSWDGSYSDGSGTGDGSYSDGSSSWDGSYSDGSSSGNGSYSDGSSSGGGSYSDGSGSGGGSYDQSIEIYDPGNGDYTYTDGSGDSSGGSSSGDSSAYTPENVIIQGISSRYISESELYNYDLGQLRLIRNEIFALNGRIFRSQDLADYFSQKSWYVPTYDPDEFDANMYYYLNDYEEANLQVILNYEAALAAAMSEN